MVEAFTNKLYIFVKVLAAAANNIIDHDFADNLLVRKSEFRALKSEVAILKDANRRLSEKCQSYEGESF